MNIILLLFLFVRYLGDYLSLDSADDATLSSSGSQSGAFIFFFFLFFSYYSNLSLICSFVTFVIDLFKPDALIGRPSESASRVSASIVSGLVTMNNIRIRKDALDAIALPITVKEGVIFCKFD